MANELALRPSYWESVSGGKDSLYMLNYILHNLDRYPLDGVVHFELEIDYPVIHDVINYMEHECNRFNIPFLRIRPRKTWEELYKLWGFPSGIVKWCNSEYKLDAKKQFEEFLRNRGFYSVQYIGYCFDEEKRWSKRKNNKVIEVYPLVEAGIVEDDILEWARNQPIYNDYYKYNRRNGCMYCPNSSLSCHAYLLKYYPENYAYMMTKAAETERELEKKCGHAVSVWQGNPKYNTEYRDKIIRTKWFPKLEKMIEENEC